MMDNDIHVLTKTGASVTAITTGANVELNEALTKAFNSAYDVVLVGGDYYDANLITQTNVLLDDDQLSVVGDLGTADGSLSTSGNLLWNQASILNVGAQWTEGLTDDLHQALGNLGAGNLDFTSALAQNTAFAGLGHLSALYVKGNVYDVHTIEQINVLGDSDRVAIYKNALAADGEPDWTVNTGGNALVNAASIVDYDTLGSAAYVGGHLYSDAVLIQAEIVEGHEENPFGDALASEAIAFLDDDAAAPAFDLDHDGHASHVASDGPPADVMQSMLT